MSISESSPRPSFGQQLIGEITQAKTSDSGKMQQAKRELAEHAGHVYQMMQNPEKLNTEEFQVAWMALCNDFQTLTHDSHSEFSALDKLKLQHVIVDITDDLKEAVLQRMEGEQEAKSKQGWGSWFMEGAAKTGAVAMQKVFGGSKERTIALAEFLKNLTGYQEAMKNPELSISLNNVKRIIAQTMEESGNPEFGEEVRGMDLKDLVEFLRKVPGFEQKHMERVKAAEERLVALEKKQEGVLDYVASTLDAIVDVAGEKAEAIGRAAYDYAMEKKDETVRSYAQGFTPQALFGGKSFKGTVEGIIEDVLKANNLDYSLIRKAASGAAEVYRGHLAQNLAPLRDVRNMARLGVKMANELQEVAHQLRGLPPNATPEDMIRALGYGNMSLQEFRQSMDKTVSHNIARLITKDAVRPNDDQTQNVAKGLWGKIKMGLKNFVRKFQRNTAKKLVANYAPPTWIVDKLPKSMQSAQGIAQTLGVNEQLQKIETFSEVIVLHLFARLTLEIGEIAGEGRKLARQGQDFNVSDFPDEESANRAFRGAVGELGEELQLFRPQEEGGLLQKGLFQLVGLFGDVVAKQGTGESLFDVTTPAFQVLQPAWTNWLAE